MGGFLTCPSVADSYDAPADRLVRVNASGQTVLVDTLGQEHVVAAPSGKTLIQTFNPDGFVRTQGGGVQIGSFPVTSYNSLVPTAQGLPVIVGFDNAAGDPRIITAVDGAPRTLYTPGVAVTAWILRVQLHLNVTAYTSGTLTYTLTWTKPDGNTATLVITGGSLNAEAHAIATVLVKSSTPITVQATGPFVLTAFVSAIIEQLL